MNVCKIFVSCTILGEFLESDEIRILEKRMNHKLWNANYIMRSASHVGIPREIESYIAARCVAHVDSSYSWRRVDPPSHTVEPPSARSE